MKEVYRSFEGKLDAGNQSGYIIYELDKYYEIHFLSVWIDESDDMVRINKDLLPGEDFGKLDKIASIKMDIEFGRGDFGQCWYKQKWYSYETICKIQSRNKDNWWKKYV